MRKKLFLFCIAGFSASILLSQQKRMFSLLPSTQTGINFNNKLVENAEHNINGKSESDLTSNKVFAPYFSHLLYFSVIERYY